MPSDSTDQPPTVHGDLPQRGRSKSPLGLLAAVVAGGIIAFGLVKLIPDDWRINLRKNAKPNGRKLTGRGQPKFRAGELSSDDEERESNTGGTESETPSPAPEAKPSPPKTQEGREAAELLKEAKELIAKGKRDEAVPLLERTYNQYPGTSAAVEALKLLNGC